MKNKHPIIEGLKIESLAAEGKGLGKWQDKVVFVPMAVPGDVVDVQIRVKRKRYMEGSVVRYVELSPMRVEPFCSHFGVCGGCKWQNVPYSEQLRFKSQQVIDQLTRIGHLELPAVRPILGSEKIREYRNKLEFTFAPRRWFTYEEIAAGGEIADSPALGFHVPGMFDKVMDVEWCYLQAEPTNAIRNEIKRFCVENGYPFYNIREHSGFMRNVVIRVARSGEVMVCVVFAEDDTEKRTRLMEHLATMFPFVTSWVYMINPKLNDSTGDLEAHTSSGRDYIVERLGDLKFRIGAKSFFQTNTAQAERLYDVVKEFAELSGEDVVYDLYTGAGTIACYVADKAKQVIGVEYVEEAIEDAKRNAADNGIGNCVFFAGDMKDVITDEFMAFNGKPDVIILDPPRAGVHDDVLQTILRAAPMRIVYVSCNPATQARDLAILAEKYRVVEVQPVDMFPHTHHIENIVKLEKY